MDGKTVVCILIVMACVIIIIIKNRKDNESRRKSDFMTIFSDGMQETTERRITLMQHARTEDDDYGYSIKNPIMESTVHSGYLFLDRLRTEDGKAITYKRTASMAVTLSGADTMIDKYTLFVDGNEYKTLYICPYGHTIGKAPKGLILAPDNKSI